MEVSSKVIVLSTYITTIAQNRAKNVEDAALDVFAIGLFNQINKLNQDEPNVHIVVGNLFQTIKRNEEAEREYITAIQQGSASFDAWQNLLALQSEANKFDSLIFYSEQGLEIFPNQAMMYYFNGYGHIRKSHYKAATQSLETAKKLSYNGTKEYAKADKAYDDALAFNPNNDFVLNNYSYYLALRKENLEKAERMAALAAKLQPSNSSFLDTYAWVLYTREKYREARKVMERAMAQPDITSTHFEHYGDILFQLGDVEGAVKQWEKARERTTQHDLIDKKIANRRLY